MKYFLRLTVFVNLLLLFSMSIQNCTDEFNDPNPKGNTLIDDTAPDLQIISPLESGLYTMSNFSINLEASDSFGLKYLNLELVSLDTPTLLFNRTYSISGKTFALDTVYRPVLNDTTRFQMLVQTSDSTGNIAAKTVNFKIYKP